MNFTLVYFHAPCEIYWPLEDGPTCPMQHDTPMYATRLPRGRKRRMWICHDCEDGNGYLSRYDLEKHQGGYHDD